MKRTVHDEWGNNAILFISIINLEMNKDSPGK